MSAERWPFEHDGAPEYVPIDRLDTLVRCARCGGVIEGDVGSQAIHRVWHDALEERIRRAGSALPQRYA